MKLITTSLAAFLVVLVASAIPSSAQSIPAEWAGIWVFTTDDEECDGPFIETYVDTVTICPGDEFGASQEGLELDCSGTITETTIDTNCSGSLEVLADCNMTITFVTQGTRTGDTISGTERTTIEYTGTGCGGFFTDMCIDGTVSGERINPDPGACSSTPSLPTTWGAIKAIYR